MSEEMSFPIEEMHAAAREIRLFLDQQWARHCSLFLTGANAYAPLANAIASQVPNASGRAQELRAELEQLHQRFHDCYAELYAIADLLDGGAQTMDHTNRDIVAPAFRAE